MLIAPEWRGESSPPAPHDGFAIEQICGCDVAPIDLCDPEAALKLKAYVWPDAPGRLARIDAAVELASASPPQVTKQDAGEFVDAMLARPQASGTTKAMFHTIMWQYMPRETQSAVTAAFEAAGAEASAEKPLAWVALETDPETFRHELKVRYWNGSAADGEAHLLAFAHPHGALG